MTHKSINNRLLTRDRLHNWGILDETKRNYVNEEMKQTNIFFPTVSSVVGQGNNKIKMHAYRGCLQPIRRSFSTKQFEVWFRLD